MAPSSRGLGLQIFILATRIRIPLALQKQFSRIFTIMYKKGRVNCYLITLHRPSSYRILIAQDVEYLRCIMNLGSTIIRVGFLFGRLCGYTQLAIWLELFLFRRDVREARRRSAKAFTLVRFQFPTLKYF